MKTIACLTLAVLACLALAEAMPAQYDIVNPVMILRARRSPARVYYRRPLNRRQGFAEEAPCTNCDLASPLDENLESFPAAPVDEEPLVLEEAAPVEPEAKTPEADDDEDEDNTFFAVGTPFGKGGSRASVNTFFPIQFGFGAGRTTDGGAAGPVAIANSFSTGRKGSATSHATSYGHPKSS